MKIFRTLGAVVLAGSVFSAQSALVPVYNYGDPTQFAAQYGDFYSFSLPILSSAVQGFTKSSVNYGSGSPYFINTANVIQDALVVGTGAGGSQNNADLGLPSGSVSDGYDFPNVSPNASGTFSFSGWRVTLDALRQYLKVGGVLYDMMGYFNNNQTQKDIDLWAKAKVTLTGANKTDQVFEFKNGYSANPPYVLSGGDVTLCFQWADPTNTGNNDFRVEVACNPNDSTQMHSTYKHNLGQNNVSYGLTSLGLNAILRDLNSGYTEMTIDVDFQGLNNGYENLYIGAACVARECGAGDVPEPGTMVLFGMALAGLGWTRCRQNGRQAIAA